MTGTVREYLYAGGEAPTAMRSRNADGTYSNFFFVTNTHGDVVALTDRDGNVVNRYAYGPWGEATRVSEQVHQPFRYAGYRYEDGFDLYYLRARWYDAATGRFLSRDALRAEPSPLVSNRYLYAGANCPSATDPTGYSPEDRNPNRVLRARQACVDRGFAVAFHPNEWWRNFLWPTVGQKGPVGRAVDVFDSNLHGYWEWGPASRKWGQREFQPPPQFYLSERLKSQGWCSLGAFWDLANGVPTQLWALYHEAAHLVFNDGNEPPEIRRRAQATAGFLMNESIGFFLSSSGFDWAGYRQRWNEFLIAHRRAL